VSYDPTTDFIALMRLTSNGVEMERMPGLDYVVSALARAGIINLSTGQTAPTVNQSSTAWLKTALPSWTAEGVLYLWNASTAQYEIATPTLWALFVAGGSKYAFQSVTALSDIIAVGTSLLAIRRVAPSTTSLALPNLIAQWATGRALQIVDFSTSVANHTITLLPSGGATIMQRTSWTLLSTADQLAGLSLQPSPDLNSWVIAP
jgi:hypothetical protein